MKVRGFATALAVVLGSLEVSLAGMSCVILSDGASCRVEGEGRGADACQTPSAESCTLLLKTHESDAGRPVAIAAYLYTFGDSTSVPGSISGSWTDEKSLVDFVKERVGAYGAFVGAAFTLASGVKPVRIGEFSTANEKVSVRIEDATPHVRVVVESGRGGEVKRLGETVLLRDDVRTIPILTKNGKGMIVVAFKQFERKDAQDSRKYEEMTFQLPQVIEKGWFKAVDRRRP